MRRSPYICCDNIKKNKGTHLLDDQLHVVRHVGVSGHNLVEHRARPVARVLVRQRGWRLSVGEGQEGDELADGCSGARSNTGGSRKWELA